VLHERRDAGDAGREHRAAQRHRFHEPSSTITHLAGRSDCAITLFSVSRMYVASSRQGEIST